MLLNTLGNGLKANERADVKPLIVLISSLPLIGPFGIAICYVLAHKWLASTWKLPRRKTLGGGLELIVAQKVV